ncbi:hypothetical protein AVEN_93376-1 [Araneus ventricosus]|uniref:Uncharacterized protein n=1 Tax=Araneus ventricosus TaxID=182803 RepID=A0A4Y2ARE4_ARAVE|nr:hypothetical protein AVEN_93376-1 [Araneus ventricosus]
MAAPAVVVGIGKLGFFNTVPTHTTYQKIGTTLINVTIYDNLTGLAGRQGIGVENSLPPFGRGGDGADESGFSNASVPLLQERRTFLTRVLSVRVVG